MNTLPIIEPKEYEDYGEEFVSMAEAISSLQKQNKISRYISCACVSLMFITVLFLIFYKKDRYQFQYAVNGVVYKLDKHTGGATVIFGTKQFEVEPPKPGDHPDAKSVPK